MNSASEYVKFGGCLGFSAVFLLVLLKNRDVVDALMDASIACVIMAMVFKSLHGLTISLERAVVENKRKMASAASTVDNEQELQPLTDGRVES